MADNIVSGLFGLDPWQIQQQQNQQIDESALQYAKLDPFQKANFAIGRGAGMLTGVGAEAMGLQNPAMVEAQQRRAALTGLDISSPESILARAQQIQDPKLKMQLMMMADQKKKEAQALAAQNMKMKLDEARIEREQALAEKALRGEPEMKYAPEIQKLIALRDAMPEGDPRRAMIEAAIRKATYVTPEKDTTATEKAPAGYRFTATGDLEAIPGGPADAKVRAADEAKSVGTESLEVTLATLRDAYNRLEKGGGITSTKRAGVSNILPALSASDLGQATGRLLGTQNQSARNDIAMARPALLAALMRATGMSAKQIDSNAELKLWLATATDPKLDLESNRKALDNIEKKYLSGKSATASSGQKGFVAKTPDEVRNLYKSGQLTRDQAKAILKDMGV